ncbi:MAG: prolyl oligopeptidase family serine peptidase [Pyrinomonadaceae bacterium]
MAGRRDIPNKFAALIPIAGEILAQGQLSQEQRSSLSPAVRAVADSSDPYAAFAAAIGNTPVWVFHGSADDAVPVEGSRKMVGALRARGNPNVQYTEFEGVGHNSRGKALRTPELATWLAGQRRN